MLKKISLIFFLFIPLLAAYSADNDFFFSSDSTSISLAKGSEMTRLKGNAKITSEDTVITADEIELYGDNFRYARCSGNILVIDSSQGIRINSENLFFDRDKELMIINGYAEMVDQKNEIVVKGSYFENRGKENFTIVQIGVRILKATDEDRMTCRSEYARYNREEDTLQLSGMPVVFWKEDEYRATRIDINLETDEITLSGEVSGTIKSEEDNKEGAEEKTDE